MYYDMNISSKYKKNEINHLENCDYKGFCINKFLTHKEIETFTGYKDILKIKNKKTFKKITVILENNNYNTKSLFTKCEVLCLKVLDFETPVDENVCDIVTCDFTKQVKFKNINPNLYYEIDLVSSLYDKSSRLTWMWNVRELLRITKCKNIIVGTGSTTFTELKSPLDIFKIFSVFDLSENKVQQIMSNSERCLEKCARKRFMSNGCVFNDIPEGDLKDEFLINKL